MTTRRIVGVVADSSASPSLFYVNMFAKSAADAGLLRYVSFLAKLTRDQHKRLAGAYEIAPKSGRKQQSFRRIIFTNLQECCRGHFLR